MSTVLWSLEEAAAAMGATPRGESTAAINGVSIDTRKLAPGDLFFAIKGENRDGHDFVDQAIEKGATSVVSIAKSFATGCEKYPCQRAKPSSEPSVACNAASSSGRIGKNRTAPEMRWKIDSRPGGGRCARFRSYQGR